MGVIIKESLLQTVIRIAVSFISALAVIFLYPKDTDLYGLISYVLSSAALLMPFIVLGLGQAAMRFFPYSGNDLTSRLNFAKFLILIFIISVLAFFAFFIGFKHLLLTFATNESADLEYYLKYICIGAILFAIIEMLVRYISNYKIVAIPIVFQNLYKLVIPISFLLIYLKTITTEIGIQIILVSLGFSAIVLLFIAIKYLYNPSSFVPKEVEKKAYSTREFLIYYFWAFASTAGSIIAFRVDGIMIPALTDFESNGDYFIAMFITTVITIPISAVLNIAHPIISQAWKENDLSEIRSVYYKGSENLLFIGVAMLLAVLLLLDFLPLVLKDWESLSFIKYIVLIMGFGRLFDMASGVNGVIIQYSKWYKYNTLFIFILVFTNVILNYFLITKSASPIAGAAIATAISLIAFNLLKALLIYLKIGMQPFNRKMMLFVISFLLLILTSLFLNEIILGYGALLANTLLGIIFLTTWMFVFRIATETTDSVRKILERLGVKI